jgi:hypothetical protein
VNLNPEFDSFQITLSPLAKHSPFDREKSSLHYLTVEARDDLGKGNRNNVELVIHVKVRCQENSQLVM